MTETATLSADVERFRRCLEDSLYVISEHVVRSLMSGLVTMTDIKTAIGRGTVIEVHDHAKRGISYLFAVLSRHTPFHVLCGSGVNGWLVIAFAYVPAPPVWATPGRRTPKGVRTMSGRFTTCYFCGGDIKTVTVGNFDYRKDGNLYVIKKVPAGLCLECGEKYLEPEVGLRMDALIEARRFTTTEAVNVIEFDLEEIDGIRA